MSASIAMPSKIFFSDSARWPGCQLATESRAWARSSATLASAPLPSLPSSDAFRSWRHVFVGAIKIGAGRQVEAAERRAVDRLRQAERIGGRHQHDLALHLVLRFQRRQFGAQELRHQYARHLVGVQRGLDIDFLAAAGRAELKLDSW